MSYSQYPGQGGPPQGGGYPSQQGGYPPQQGGYPPQQGGGYPSQQGGYPPQRGGPPGYPSQGGYPPQGGPPQGGGYPPQGGPPQGGGYPPQGGPPQGGGAPNAQGLSSQAQQFYNQIPPQELETLKKVFASLDKNKSGQISAVEMSATPFDGVKFTYETAQMLVRVFDREKNGEISFYEFASVHKFVLSMQAAYRMYDRDRSGTIDYNEALQAAQQGGFGLSPQTFQSVFNRFVRNPLLNPKNIPALSLEQFMQLCAFLGAARGSFSQFDYQRSGWVTINLDQYINMTTYLP